MKDPHNWTARSLTFLERHARTISIILVLLASVRIALTWTTFNVTTDEGAHIACGMEWLDRGTYQLEDEHPPLARVVLALGPYLFGARSHGESNPSLEGRAILLAQGDVGRTLLLARAGILPFFWVACAVVYLWTKRLFGAAPGVMAVAIFTNTPAILAHAGLATTDMALTGMLGAAVLAVIIWVEHPSIPHSLLLGTLGGLAVLSKFSSLPFFVFALAAMVIWHVTSQLSIVSRIKARHLGMAALSLLIACLVIWAGYRFSFGPVRNKNATRPAPELFSGIKAVRQHNGNGHLAYLAGEWSQTGFWDYYLVDFGLKTPLAELALILVGAGVCIAAWRRNPRIAYPLLFSLGILGVAVIYGRINIGIRHILPVYLGFSVVAAGGMSWLLHRRRAASIGALLLAWLLLDAGLHHPDYLGYFNPIAGSKPETYLIDSDLDWGQDMKRLANRLQQLGVTDFNYLPLIYPELSGAKFPEIHTMDIVQQPAAGWYAAHITALKLSEHEILRSDPTAQFWPESIPPTERIGEGILLWHLP